MPPPRLQALADQAADTYGIPRNLFRALIRQESGWRPRVRSKAGAIGLAQLMPGTAEGLGVDPYDPAQNLDGGARYLSQQFKRFGSWKLALAAYNAGPGRVESGAWQDIPETTSYVRNVLAMAGRVRAPGVRPDPSGAPGAAAVAAPELPPLPDFSQQALAGLSTVGTREFDPVAQLSDLTMAVAQQRMAAPPPMVGAPAPAPARAPGRAAGGRQPRYSSLNLGKVIGTPGAGTHTVGNWQSDNAWDISIPVGTPIRADADGVIGDRIGYLGDPNDQGRFAGMRVNLRGRKNAYYYAHLSKLNVKAGQRVRKGQIIGWSGAANGVPHLHFGVQHI